MAHQDVKRVLEASEYLQRIVPPELQNPIVGIICGSGLGGLADLLLHHPQVAVAYAEIPHFANSTVSGHAGTLLFGVLEHGQSPVVLMVGRLHYYEGHSMSTTTFPVRLMKRLGVGTVIGPVTNATGGLNPDYSVGDVVVVSDHINLAGLAGVHPLLGPNAAEFGVRFPAMSDAYDLGLRRLAHQKWKHLNASRKTSRRLHEGVYAFAGGPNYETRAECRVLKMVGADLVGMSTVPEVIVARHADMRILALSLVTNKAVLEAGPRGDEASIQVAGQDELRRTIEAGKASHDEVLETAQAAQKDVQTLVFEIAKELLREGIM